MDADKKSIDGIIVLELAMNPVDNNGEPYRIHKVLCKGEYNFDLYEFNLQDGFGKAFMDGWMDK